MEPELNEPIALKELNETVKKVSRIICCKDNSVQDKTIDC